MYRFLEIFKIKIVALFIGDLFVNNRKPKNESRFVREGKDWHIHKSSYSMKNEKE